MLKMTSGFIIKLRRFLDLIFKSFASQSTYIFSYPILKKYGNIVKFSVEYYQPRRIHPRRGFMFLQQLLKVLSYQQMTNLIKGALHLPQSQPFKLQSRVSRLKTPAMDSYILAQFFVYISRHHHFRKIIQRMRRTVVYKFLNHIPTAYGSNDPLHSKDRV